MTIPEFFNAVEHFDWFHEMSDDGRVYRAGEATWSKLRQETNGNPTKEAIMRDWSAFHYSGESWGKPQAKKPALTDYCTAVQIDFTHDVVMNGTKLGVVYLGPNETKEFLGLSCWELRAEFLIERIHVPAVEISDTQPDNVGSGNTEQPASK